jgi:hypothetical protein
MRLALKGDSGPPSGRTRFAGEEVTMIAAIAYTSYVAQAMDTGVSALMLLGVLSSSILSVFVLNKIVDRFGKNEH